MPTLSLSLSAIHLYKEVCFFKSVYIFACSMKNELPVFSTNFKQYILRVVCLSEGCLLNSMTGHPNPLGVSGCILFCAICHTRKRLCNLAENMLLSFLQCWNCLMMHGYMYLYEVFFFLLLRKKIITCFLALFDSIRTKSLCNHEIVSSHVDVAVSRTLLITDTSHLTEVLFSICET